jgi:hypothetical protein
MAYLFIGGSFTSDGDIPGAFKHIVDYQLGRNVDVHAVTFARARLIDHWERKESRDIFAARPWKAVILQEQSKLPLADPHEMYKGVSHWVAASKAKGITPILLMTWRRRDDLAAPEVLGSLILAYRTVAQKCGVTLAPVGIAWELLRQKCSVELMQPLNSHASPLGASLTALSLGLTIFGTVRWSPNLLTVLPTGVNETDLIQAAIDAQEHGRSVAGTEIA